MGKTSCLSSSYSLVAKRNPHVVTGKCSSQVFRGFLFLEEQTLALFLQVLLLPCYSNKKAKDSGGGTPDFVGTGFNSLQCLAFSVRCVGN